MHFFIISGPHAAPLLSHVGVASAVRLRSLRTPSTTSGPLLLVAPTSELFVRHLPQLEWRSGAVRCCRWSYRAMLHSGCLVTSILVAADTRSRLWWPRRPSFCDSSATVFLLLTGEARLALQDGRERAAHRLPRPQRGPTHRLGGATCAGRPVRPPWRPALVGTRVVGELCACEIGGVNRG